MTKESFNAQKLGLEIIKDLPPRSQDIIKKRYGILDNKPKTLEAIGKEYGITRERVRQIVDSALKNLKTSQTFSVLAPFYKFCLKLFEESGGIEEGEKFVKKINESLLKGNQQAAIYFLLILNPELEFVKEDKLYRSFWHLKTIKLEKIKKDLNSIEKYLKKEKRPLTTEEILNFARKEIDKNISENLLKVYLNISKNIERNIFGEYGLSSLDEIQPPGVGERAYVMLKHINKSMHFTEIANKLNELSEKPKEAEFANTSSRWFKKVQVQTVHNELIRDPRFVLIGRGIYALRDWGYKPGKVDDVIKEVLAKAGKPLTQKEIIDEVKKYRLAKDNTIVLNLHNKKYFKRLPDKRFTLNRKKSAQPGVLEI
ncbi:MAG TPA: sigma factor-like helix-turn-helix DNA-binding protein [Candidatus Paceibacterota bacterium]|nr:sigma factor-like helix-turn-helix DNA-binding protein [Candidatus Paceibacterota bacterium]